MNSLWSIGRYLISEFYSIGYFSEFQTPGQLFKYSEFAGIVKDVIPREVSGFRCRTTEDGNQMTEDRSQRQLIAD